MGTLVVFRWGKNVARHENASHMGRVFVSGWTGWVGRNAGRHENASHMGRVFVPGRTGWVEKTNRPKWAHWWEGMQPDTKTRPIWDAFSCLAGETPPHGRVSRVRHMRKGKTPVSAFSSRSIQKTNMSKKRKKTTGVPLTPPLRCPIPLPNPPYPSLGPSAASPIVFSTFSTSRGRWCVVVRARCCGHILAVAAVSLTCRGGGDWGGGRWGMVGDHEGRWWWWWKSVIINGSLSWRVSCHVIRPSGLNKMHNFVGVPTSSFYHYII